jgi:hypothetical protein
MEDSRPYLRNTGKNSERRGRVGRDLAKGNSSAQEMNNSPRWDNIDRRRVNEDRAPEWKER